MSWIAVTDRHLQRFSEFGLGSDRHHKPVVATDTGTVMPVGTLMIEAQITGEERPETLLNLRTRSQGIPRSFTISSIPGGGVSLIHTLGQQTRHAAIQHGGTGRACDLRISFSWNTRSGWARLALERPDTTQIATQRIDGPLPVLLSDMQKLVLDPVQHNHNFIFAGLSTRIEPLGPAPSIYPATPVATPDGYRPVGDLRRGEIVLTRSGRQVPVLHSVRRRAPAKGSFQPIRLHAPYFGLRKDVIVAPSQRLVISGSEVEYMFGVEAVLVPAGHLVHGRAATREPAGPVTEYCQIVLPGHEALDAAGGHLESLYVGRIRRDPEALNASVLCNVPRNSLPEHASPAFPVIGAYEAITLAEQRAA